MFQMIGAGDKAGSGIDKIRRGWETQQWRSPSVRETTQPDRVKFVLPMVSLIPPESEARLRHLFGDDYGTLTPIEVQTLVTADLEGEVSNSRLQLIRAEHPVELTKMLQGLASRGFLDQVGQKRWCSYRLPEWASPFASGASPFVASGSTDVDARLLEIARPAREKKKLAPELTKKLIRQLCSDDFLTAERIANLMERRKDKLQEYFLATMVANGELVLKYSDQPTHPEQAYRTNPDRRST